MVKAHLQSIFLIYLLFQLGFLLIGIPLKAQNEMRVDAVVGSFVGTEPRPINMDTFKQRIGYPPTAWERNIQGKVIVRVLVDEQGRYEQHEILLNPAPVLTKAVEAKLPMLRFTPAIQNGSPVKCWVTFPIHFKLAYPPDPNQPPPVTRTCHQSLEDALVSPDEVLELYLVGENLTSFPMEVLKLKNLQKLELRDNQISAIPDEIAQLTQLKHLGLHGNQLSDLPATVWTMKNLTYLDVSGNPFTQRKRHQLRRAHENVLQPKDEKGKVIW